MLSVPLLSVKPDSVLIAGVLSKKPGEIVIAPIVAVLPNYACA